MSAELIETLKANWDSQRSAIATAQFRARAFRTGAMKQLSPNEVASVFRSVDLAGRPDDLRTVVAAICVHKTFATPDPWAPIDVIIDGDRVRERSSDTADGMEDDVADAGVVVIGRTDIHQVGIIRRSESHHRFRSLDDFRLLPMVGDAETLNVAAHDAGSGRVKLIDSGSRRIELDVDEANGFVYALRRYTDDGSLGEEYLQFGPTTYAGDLVLPTASARLKYHAAGKLSYADILVVEDARVNVDLPRDAFVISAPKGTLIADSRDSRLPRRTRRFYAKDEIDDVVASFPLDESRPERAKHASLDWRFIGLCAAAFFAAMLVIWLSYARHTWTYEPRDGES